MPPTSKPRRPRAAAPAAPTAASAAPPAEAALYAPDPDAVTIDGARFRLGKMRIGPSLRFTALATQLISRGNQVTRTLLTLPEGPERDAVAGGLNLLALLPEDDLAELVAIALSNESAVDRAWVKEHWDLDWVLPLLARFTETNPLGRYFLPLGKVLGQVISQMAPPPAPAHGTR